MAGDVRRCSWKFLGYFLCVNLALFVLAGLFSQSVSAVAQSLVATEGKPWYTVTNEAADAFFSNSSIVVVLLVVIFYLRAEIRFLRARVGKYEQLEPSKASKT